MCQARRLSQSIMEIYGQESQRRMAQILPESVECFYQGLVSAHFSFVRTAVLIRAVMGMDRIMPMLLEMPLITSVAK